MVVYHISDIREPSKNYVATAEVWTYNFVRIQLNSNVQL